MVILLIPLKKMYNPAQRQPSIADQSVVELVIVFGFVIELVGSASSRSRVVARRFVSASIAGNLCAVATVRRSHSLAPQFQHSQNAEGVAGILQVVKCDVSSPHR